MLTPFYRCHTGKFYTITGLILWVAAGGFNLKLFPSFWSSWHVTLQILLFLLTCKTYIQWQQKQLSSQQQYKPLPCSQFLKPIHLREVYPVKRWKKPDSSFHLSYCLFPCFTHSPPPFWSPLQNSFPACLHYSMAPFYSLVSSVIFLFLFS